MCGKGLLGCAKCTLAFIQSLALVTCFSALNPAPGPAIAKPILPPWNLVLLILTPKHLHHCSQIEQRLHCIKGNAAMWFGSSAGKQEQGSRLKCRQPCTLASTHFASLEPLPRPISLILPPLPPPPTTPCPILPFLPPNHPTLKCLHLPP